MNRYDVYLPDGISIEIVADGVEVTAQGLTFYNTGKDNDKFLVAHFSCYVGWHQTAGIQSNLEILGMNSFDGWRGV